MDMFTDYRLRQREYLLRISRAMTSRLDLPSLLRLILQSAVEIVGGQAGLVVLRNEDGSMRPVAGYGLPVQAIELFAPLWRDLPGAEGEKLQIPDIGLRLELASAAAGVRFRQVVALPLTIADEVTGFIFVLRGRGAAFSPDDHKLLDSFADQAAIAVQNARLYQQVSEERARLDAIIQNSGDGVMILDPGRRILKWNRTLARMTGHSAETAIGSHCYDMLDLRNVQGVSICHTACPLMGEPVGGRYYVQGDTLRRDGVRLTLADNYAPQFDERGNIVGVIANVRDISSLREAEELKNTLLSIISHELKTPVSIIKGYAGTLSREDAKWDEGTIREGLRVIEEETDKLTKLIDNLLDASRLQAGGMKLDFAYLDLPRMAERSVERLRSQAAGASHKFELDFPPDFPMVSGDYSRIGEVFDNLIGNAIKYSPEGGTVRVGGYVEGENAVCFVGDEGIGIPESEHEQIFDRFYRVDDSHTRRTQGAGLGLYLVKAVMEAHGGSVRVESSPGEGSTFYFTFPLTFPPTFPR